MFRARSVARNWRIYRVGMIITFVGIRVDLRLIYSPTRGFSCLNYIGTPCFPYFDCRDFRLGFDDHPVRIEWFGLDLEIIYALGQDLNPPSRCLDGRSRHPPLGKVHTLTNASTRQITDANTRHRTYLPPSGTPRSSDTIFLCMVP